MISVLSGAIVGRFFVLRRVLAWCHRAMCSVWVRQCFCTPNTLPIVVCHLAFRTPSYDAAIRCC